MGVSGGGRGSGVYEQKDPRYPTTCLHNTVCLLALLFINYFILIFPLFFRSQNRSSVDRRYGVFPFALCYCQVQLVYLLATLLRVVAMLHIGASHSGRRCSFFFPY